MKLRDFLKTREPRIVSIKVVCDGMVHEAIESIKLASTECPVPLTTTINEMDLTFERGECLDQPKIDAYFKRAGDGH